MSRTVLGSTFASCHIWPERVCRNTETRRPSARRSRAKIKTFSLIRSRGASGGEYQSVMITPPNGSAELSGKKEMVSRDARHSKLFTLIPRPVPMGLSPPNSVSISPPLSLETDDLFSVGGGGSGVMPMLSHADNVNAMVINVATKSRGLNISVYARKTRIVSTIMSPWPRELHLGQRFATTGSGCELCKELTRCCKPKL